MQVSREFAIKELEAVRDGLAAWIKDLDAPMGLTSDGSETPFYPEGVPVSLSVAELEGIPVSQLRAELLAMAAKLEALASF